MNLAKVLLMALALPAASAKALPLKAQKIAAGRNHTCALTADGGVACWGDGTRGQLGNAQNRNASKPQRVIGLANVTAIAAGGYHSCAVLASGRVTCWGAGTDGQLGYGTEPGTTGSRDASQPKDVQGLGTDTVALAAGDAHTCALAASGVVKCWGLGSMGQMGDGMRNPQPGIWYRLRTASTTVQGIVGQAAQIAAGGNHTCVQTTAGDVYCWGAGAQGQLGDGARTAYATRAVQSGVRGVTAIDAGEDHSCAVTGGALACWGDAEWGQLGAIGEGADAYAIERAPVEVHNALNSGVRLVAAGRGHTCVVQNQGGGDEVRCLGDRTLQELGPETTRPWITPQTKEYWFAQRVSNPRTVPGAGTQIGALVSGNKHSCTLDGGGSVHCWGHGFFGQLGNGQAREAGEPQLVNW